MRAAILTAVVAFSCGCTTVITPSPIRPASSATFDKPKATKVVLVILENKNPDQAKSQSFLADLAANGAYLSNYYAVAHPSQPNYVALISGSTDGVSADRPASLNRPHIGQFLTSWKLYAEGYPGHCDLSEQVGSYARKHVPFLSFTDVQRNQGGLCDRIVEFHEFPADAWAGQLPSLSLVVPNLDNDAHDKGIEVADRWLAENIGPLLADQQFRNDTVLIVTFDENADRWPYGNLRDNRVYTVFWGADVVAGQVDDVYTHYDLLRTIEAIFGISPMADGDRAARPITGIWRRSE